MSPHGQSSSPAEPGLRLRMARSQVKSEIDILLAWPKLQEGFGRSCRCFGEPLERGSGVDHLDMDDLIRTIKLFVCPALFQVSALDSFNVQHQDGPQPVGQCQARHVRCAMRATTTGSDPTNQNFFAFG